MDSCTPITDAQKALIDKLTESAGELLFEASATSTAQNGLRQLAHALGQLYGETIRQTKYYQGLQTEVQTRFMSGMAIEPNFGREEEAAKEKEAKDKATRALYLERFPEHAKLQEEKARALVENASTYKGHDMCGNREPCLIGDGVKLCCSVMDEARAKLLATVAKPEGPAKLCPKCKNTGNMGFSTYMRCDACE